MNTRLVMTICALVLGITGILFSFLPQEVAKYLGWAEGTHMIVLQILGALYFGFAMVNWTAKANLIGGIYGRPIAMGNFAHFLIGALALIKLTIETPPAITLVIVTFIYAVFAIIFGYILFKHPGLKKETLTT